MESIEYSVTTKAEPEVAWKVFCDWELWPEFSDIYGEIRWVKGEPWQPGSRLAITVLAPIRISFDHVITVCEVNKKVAWIDHALGTTMEQRVQFERREGGGTHVHTWAEFTGMMPMIAGRKMKEVLLEFTVGWYDRFAAKCDQAAAVPPPGKPGG